MSAHLETPRLATVVALDTARWHLPARDRRSRDPVDTLSRRHDRLCNAATDPWEIAAGLEAEGIGDHAAQQLGYPDVFALAEELYERVPRRGSVQVTGSSRPRPSSARALGRGLIYALPAIVSVGILQQATASALVVCLLAIAQGWGWGQAMSFLGYRRLGWTGEAAARQVLRAGLLVGLVLVSASVLVAARTLRLSSEAALPALGFGAYMVAAGVVLVLGHDAALLAALAPGSVAGILLIAGRAPWGPAGQAVLAAVCVVSVVVLAVAVTRARPGRASGRPGTGRVVYAEELVAALPHLAYGIVCAGLVGMGPPMLAALRGQQPAAAWPAALPLVLSMGIVELQLGRLRTRLDAVLWTATAPQGFAAAARAAVLKTFALFTAVVALLCLVALVLPWPAGDDGSLVLVVSYGTLALAFWIALVLVAVGLVVTVFVSMAGALAGYLAAASAWPASAASAYAVALALLLVHLLAVAMWRLRSPLLHL